MRFHGDRPLQQGPNKEKDPEREDTDRSAYREEDGPGRTHYLPTKRAAHVLLLSPSLCPVGFHSKPMGVVTHKIAVPPASNKIATRITGKISAAASKKWSLAIQSYMVPTNRGPQPA